MRTNMYNAINAAENEKQREKLKKGTTAAFLESNDLLKEYLNKLGENQKISTQFRDMPIDRAIYDGIGKVCKDKKIDDINSLSEELKKEIIEEVKRKLGIFAKEDNNELMDYLPFINSLKDNEVDQDEFGKNRDEMITVKFYSDSKYSKYADELMDKLARKVSEPNGKTKYIVNTDFVNTMRKNIDKILAKGCAYDIQGNEKYNNDGSTKAYNELIKKIGIDNSGVTLDYTVSKIKDLLNELVELLESGKEYDIKLKDFIEWYNLAISSEITLDGEKHQVNVSDAYEDKKLPDLEDINDVMAGVVGENMMVSLKRNGRLYSIWHYSDFTN